MSCYLMYPSDQLNLIRSTQFALDLYGYWGGQMGPDLYSGRGFGFESNEGFRIYLRLNHGPGVHSGKKNHLSWSLQFQSNKPDLCQTQLS